MAIIIVKHEEGWEADIEEGDQIQMTFNGSPLAETLVTVPTGYTARVYLRYNIKKNET